VNKIALVSRQPDSLGAEHPLSQGQVTLGRGPDNDVVLDGPGVSRHHARIECANSGCTIQDLESKNGTWINDQRIESVTPLHHGDIVRFGDLAFVFRTRGESTMTLHGTPAYWGGAMSEVASAVGRERPDLRAHAAPDGTVTILFSDVEGSAPITERLGDHRWLEVLHAHNEIVGQQAAAHGGFIVKSQGDSFMLAFQSARRAILCAVAVQRGITRYSDEHPDEPLRVRIGLHTGEVIKEADDFFGKNVILASRIAEEAAGGEILVSSLLKELTESAGDITFVEGRTVKLKGLVGTHLVYAVPWEQG
jgi:class 3 adenylate cyclase